MLFALIFFLLITDTLIATGLSCATGTRGVCRASQSIKPIRSHNTDRAPQLLIFVSFAMPMATLRALATHVQAVGGALVFRGLVDGSFPKTAGKFKELNKAALIDPTLFERYNVNVVPTFVLHKGQDERGQEAFDRLSGHVSLSHVLERFQQQGDTSATASMLLSKRQVRP